MKAVLVLLQDCLVLAVREESLAVREESLAVQEDQFSTCLQSVQEAEFGVS
jgi:hypothetical protein